MLEPDPAAIRAATQGDVDAFEVLVRHYQEPLLRFLWRQVGDRSLAEDLAQETFLRAFRALPRFGFRSKFSTWLFQIAHNAAVDARRAAARRDQTRRSLQSLAGADATRASQSSADRGATNVEFAAALAALHPIERAALLAVEVLGFSYREAGQVLDVPEGTVKRRVFDARRRLTAWAAAAEKEAGGEV